MAKGLTTKALEKAKPDPKRRLEIPDGLLPGLYLVIQRSGVKSWAIRYRANGKPAKLTLGRFPVIELAKARGIPRGKLEAVAKGEDPAAKEARESDRSSHDRPTRHRGGPCATSTSSGT